MTHDHIASAESVRIDYAYAEACDRAAAVEGAGKAEAQRVFEETCAAHLRIYRIAVEAALRERDAARAALAARQPREEEEVR